jgi:hypothetical protein
LNWEVTKETKKGRIKRKDGEKEKSEEREK